MNSQTKVLNLFEEMDLDQMVERGGREGLGSHLDQAANDGSAIINTFLLYFYTFTDPLVQVF